DGCLSNSDRAFFDRRLYEKRELQAWRPHDLLSLEEYAKSRHGDAVKRRDFLGQSLVVRECEPARITTRIGLLEQLEVTDDVLVEERGAVGFFAQVERNVSVV